MLKDKTMSISDKYDLYSNKKTEFGILFHSLFIGMALAVSVGREQVVLLIVST